MDLIEQFKTPGKEYRGKPFWAWNGDLNATEMIRQVHILKKMGMGGAFLHSRVGLRTKYLGDEWFDITRKTIDEMVLCDMEPWLYDEDRWPSGYAGGIATEPHDHRMKAMVMEIIPIERYTPQTKFIATWSANIDGKQVKNLERLSFDYPSSSDAAFVLAFYVETMPESPWFNEKAYLDVMSEKAVQAFLQSTHEEYKSRLTPEQFKHVRGMFTDEPSYTMFIKDQTPQAKNDNAYAFIPWTDDLDARFMDTYKYNLIEILPALFMDTNTLPFTKHRVDYRNLCTNLFVHRFTKKCHDWCEEHGWDLTGHVLFEEPLHHQVMAVGSAMRHYEYMQAPGMDLLTQFYDEYDTAKQVQSIKHQFDKSIMLSEMYGCTGWDFPLEGHKALGDWQAALGVNLRCHHLSWYTMAGEAKRDYPASIFFQSAWHEHYKYVEDYYARIHVALEAGRAVQKIGVIHPVETMFARYTPPLLNDGKNQWGMLEDQPENIKEVSESMKRVRDWLLNSHYDFDYIDEDILARHGEVTIGSSPQLNVAEAAYEVIIVPPIDVIRESTCRFLIDFAHAGGQVIIMDGSEAVIQATCSSCNLNQLEHIHTVAMRSEALTDCIRDKFRTVSLQNSKNEEDQSLIYQLRRDGADYVLFICNRDRKHDHKNIKINVKAHGNVYELRPETGDLSHLQALSYNDSVQFMTDFAPSGSHLYLITPKELEAPSISHTKKARVFNQSLGALLQAIPTEKNVAVLDYPSWRFGDEDSWRNPDEILKVDSAIRNIQGWPQRNGSMVQPWAAEIDRQGPTLELKYEFLVPTTIDTKIALAMEQAERWEVILNGTTLECDGGVFWIDTAFKCITLSNELLRVNSNILILKTSLKESTDLEALYLIGDFHVETTKGIHSLTPPTSPVKHGNWSEQGYPYYGGAMKYTYQLDTSSLPTLSDGETAYIEFPQFEAAMIHVVVNGEKSQTLAWEPYEIDITEILVSNDVLNIDVFIYGSRKNTFGPLHQVDTNPAWIGPMNFRTEGGDWTDTYVVKPYGLMVPPEIYIYKELVE